MADVGGAVADVVNVLVLLVEIAAVWVRIPIVQQPKMEIGRPLCTEGAPMIQPGPEWKTSVQS